MKASAKHTIVAVDTENDFLEWISHTLKSDGVEVKCFTDSGKAAECIEREKPELVIAESHMKPMGGLELLKRSRLADPNCMVLLLSNFPSTTMVIEAMRAGAYDFLGKSNLVYELRPVVERALTTVESRRHAGEALPGGHEFDILQETMVGISPSMHEVLKMVGRVSRSDAPVTVTGESGVGKEVVARAIHRFSMRAKNEFHAINCAAIPENLIESELFGHEKGSFTGASAQRVGRFEQCDKGTLFLDEIGDLPMQAQTKLLRVLQEGEFSRVGGNMTLRSDVRILAATHKNIEKEVAAGKFREDLFYRLNVVRIHIPPLRERKEDIPHLARFFLQKITKSPGARKARLSDEALHHLENYQWPGNVRELENTLQRACALAHSDILLAQDIPLGQGGAVAEPGQAAPTLDEIVASLLDYAGRNPGIKLMPHLEEALARAALSMVADPAEAARLVGITPNRLGKLVGGDG
jgi:DNA-binding NtrC family response regulator